MSARRCSVNDNIFVPFTGCRSRAQCSEGLDSFTPHHHPWSKVPSLSCYPEKGRDFRTTPWPGRD